MVGKEATTETLASRLWRSPSSSAFAAALILPVLLVIMMDRSAMLAEAPQFIADSSSESPRPSDSLSPSDSSSPVAQASFADELISPDPIKVSGNTVKRWQIDHADASLLEGDCLLQHNGRQIAADSILLVVDGRVGNIRNRLVIGGAMMPEGKSSEPLTFEVRTLVDPQIQSPILLRKPEQPPSLLRYLNASSGVVNAVGGNESDEVRRVQFDSPIINPPVAGPPPITMSDGATTGGMQFIVGGGTRSVEILARGASSPPEFSTVDRPEINESALVFRGGVTMLIRDVSAQMPGGEMMDLGTISLSADRVVGWFPLLSNLLNGSAEFSQADGELYLEGDIVFRQGERIIYADAMYFNISQEVGMILDAEAITTVPDYQGVVRLKSKVLQQINRGNYRAFDAAVTTSRMGVPRYWLQSEQLQLTDRQRMVVDPATGRQSIQRDPFVESTNNFVYVGGVPILYWPTFATSLDQPGYYITGASVGNDSIFGAQAMLDFDMFQLLGIENAPPGVDWELSTDYFSDRGPAIGTTLDYTLPGLLGYPGPVKGSFDAWGIHDTGRDNLGRDRRNLDPETTNRGRALLRHRHYLPNDFEFIAEVGYLSDRNFLEQYFENEWDQEVDHRNALRLRKYYYGNLIDLSANVQTNDFFTETEELPTLDHYLLGGSLLGDRLTYSTHNSVGYQRLNVADLPVDPAEAAQYSPIPGEIDRSGVVASTKHELALPVQLGPVKIVPNIGGEASHYGEAVDGNSLTRLVGQAGVRASLPMWNVDPSVQSSLLNVRGLAHKLEWTAEYLYADSDTNFSDVPYYDPLDDNAQEQFRRRFIQDTYGGSLPNRFDPRTYALRQGFQGLIASPSDVIADDLQQFRFGLHQRWQTKRGLPGAERITDLFQFDVDTLIFPNADRDNFGETIGPTLYDMRYHIGDRVTLLSDGYFDFFSDGLRSVSAGVRSSRPGVGDIYLGLLSIEGPVSSTVLRSTVDYRLNEKWIANAGTTYDFGPTGNVGQSIGVTRIGESMLLKLGVNIDAGRDNVGFRFAVEPRFWPRPRLGRLGGQLIPPPGIEGLE